MATIIERIQNRLLSRYYSGKDYRTDRHIVVFESDDWGSIRMSGKTAWDKLLAQGYSVNKRPYERFDILESVEDIEALFDILRKYADSQGHHPVLTANMLMTNPDFEKIRENGFSQYVYEPIEATYNRYYGNSKVLDLMREGKTEGLFMPQSHGREHFNVAKWMKSLQSRDEDTMTAFDYNMCGIAPKAHPELGNQMMGALRASSEREQIEMEHMVEEGLKLFEELWGFSSKTFVAPTYAWNDRIEQVLARGGVKLIQAARASKPTFKQSSKYYYSGQKNKNGLIYSVRNCIFEPANASGDEADRTLSQIEHAFRHNRLAIVCTHRINYVGGLHEQNRTKNLQLLDKLLQSIVNQWSDVSFLSSDKLADVYIR